MLTAKRAAEIAAQANNKYLKSILKLIEAEAVEGKKKITIKLTMEGKAAFNPAYAPGIIKALKGLGYTVKNAGVKSPKYAPDYKAYFMDISWETTEEEEV